MDLLTRVPMLHAAVAALVSLQLAGCSTPAAPASSGNSPQAAIAADTAIRLGRLINPADGTVIDHAVVLVKDDRITYVGKDGVRIPPSARIVDWSRYTGLPGFVDAHTHLTFVTDDFPGTNLFSRRWALDDETFLRLARENALAGLKVGVTTMIDKGGDRFILQELKKEIAQGTTPGPRLFLAAEGLWRAWPTNTVRVLGGIFGAEDIVPEIRRQVREGSDIIKVFADYCTDRRLDCQQTFSAADLGVAVQEAHRLGRPVAIHAIRPDAARDAVAAGADAVDHPPDLDQATLDDMVKRGTVYIPTVDHNRYYSENGEQFGVTPVDQQVLSAYLQRNVETLRAAHRSGVRVAMGSDAVFHMFGQNTRELAWFVKAGMSPLEALRAATVNSAASIHREKEIGALAPGYFADIVAVEGDPLTNIEAAIQGVRRVMVGGKVVDLNRKSAEPPSSSAEVAADVPTGADAARDLELKHIAEGIFSAFTNSEPALVPGGKSVVFVSGREGLPKLYVADSTQPREVPRCLSTGNAPVSSPVFTPDGRSVVFRSHKFASGASSLFRVDLDGKNLSELTPEGELLRDSPFVPKKASPPVVVYGGQTLGEWRQRILVQGLSSTDKPRLAYMSALPGRLLDVSSSGRQALMLEMASTTEASLVLVELATGTTKTIYPPLGEKAGVVAARITADELGAIVASDDGGERLLLARIDLVTGKETARHLDAVPVQRGSVDLECSPTGKQMALGITTGNHTLVRLVDAATLAPVREVAVPVGTGTLGAFSEDGRRLLLTLSTFSSPRDIYWADVSTGKVAPLRQDARAGLSGLPPADASVTEVRSFDGTRVPVNLFLPKARLGQTRPSPVLVMFGDVPFTSSSAGWDGMRRFYAAQGYAIVEPNIRGTPGFGRAYQAADQGRKRLDSLKDADAVARWVASQPWADKERMVVFGLDYGGFVALMQLTRQANVWRGGVDLIGFPDFGSLANTRFRDFPWIASLLSDDAKEPGLLDSISPLRNVAAIKAPLFVYAAAKDPFIHRSQPDAIVRTLREKGVAVEYMVVSDEGHSLERTQNQLDVLARSARFLENVLGRNKLPGNH